MFDSYFEYKNEQFILTNPLIETDESLRWATIIENNFDEPDNRFFMPAKVLNKYWSRKSENNQKITLDALELYNKACK